MRLVSTSRATAIAAVCQPGGVSKVSGCLLLSLMDEWALERAERTGRSDGSRHVSHVGFDYAVA